MHYHIKEHNNNRKIHFFNFFHSKAYGFKFDFALTQVHHYTNFQELIP